MNKKTIIIIVACLVVAAGGGFFLWSRSKKKKNSGAGTTQGELTPESVGKIGEVLQHKSVPKISDVVRPPAGIDLAPKDVEVVESGEQAEIVEEGTDTDKETIVLDNGTEITKPDGIQTLSDGTLVLGTLERGIRMPQSLIAKYSAQIPEAMYDVDDLYYPQFDTLAERSLYMQANSHKQVLH